MNILLVLLFGILAYLLGSIPTAVWIGKTFYGTDVREHGSGNAGFSNTLRVIGPKAGIPVLIIDVAKGYAAVWMARFLETDPAALAHELIPIIYGILAFVGHLVPVFAGFQGGKGVATGLGIILALFPWGALIGVLTFLLTIFTFRMMSLGSMLGSVSLPISVFLFHHTDRPVLLAFSAFLALSILFTHRFNIRRISQGRENKIWFRKKKEST